MIPKGKAGFTLAPPAPPEEPGLQVSPGAPEAQFSTHPARIPLLQGDLHPQGTALVLPQSTGCQRAVDKMLFTRGGTSSLSKASTAPPLQSKAWKPSPMRSLLLWGFAQTMAGRSSHTAYPGAGG